MSFVTIRDLEKVFENGTRALSALDLDADEGEFIVLVGPSGCGKSTLLRMLAGLEQPTSGTIHLRGEEIEHLLPRERDIAMIFQDYALYPHMTVRENIRFPLKVEGVNRSSADEQVAAVAASLDLGELLDRRPAQLSGGQRQRVAMGRALVRSPQLFLMDEPLSNLDSKLRVQMRSEIKTLQARLGVTTFYVTHDQTEAMTMGDRIAVLRKGKLQQYAAPRELYRTPANVFVAGFIGSPEMNLVRGRVADGRVHVGAGSFPADKEGLDPNAGEVIVGLRPHSLVVSDDPHALVGRVGYLEWLGTVQHLHVDIPGVSQLERDEEETDERHWTDDATIVVGVEEFRDVTVGDEIRFAPRPTRFHIFDLATGARIGA